MTSTSTATAATTTARAARSVSPSVEQTDDSLIFRVGGRELTRYVFAAPDDQYESPRPYFHPINTLGGDLVSVYRPWDHIWHKGLSWMLPNVGTENFWGGWSYTRETEYRNLPNNGAMRHRGFTITHDDDTGAIDVVESLDWITQGGDHIFTEERAFRIALVTEDGDGDIDAFWSILFHTEMTNVGDAAIAIGSPTTEGRPNAGYGGLFWRGPRSFTGGVIHTPDADGADELMGTRSPWIAFTGRHDETCRFSTVTFAEDPTNAGAPNKWFARTANFGCLGSAPFFSEVVEVSPGASISYRYGVAIADGDAPDGASARFGETLLDALSTWRG